MENILKITNTFDLTKEDVLKILAETKNNYLDVYFDKSIDSQKIIEIITNFLSYENDQNNTVVFFKFHIKELSFNIKKQLFKTLLKNYEITNPIIVLNLIMFIRSYNDFADEFFALENIYVNDITEFLDIKLELKDEFDCFITELAKWYYSIFKCIHKVEFNFLENTQKMPKIFEKIITSSDFVTISGIISKSCQFSFSDLYLVENAMIYIMSLSQKMNFTSVLSKNDLI